MWYGVSEQANSFLSSHITLDLWDCFFTLYCTLVVIATTVKHLDSFTEQLSLCCWIASVGINIFWTFWFTILTILKAEVAVNPGLLPQQWTALLPFWIEPKLRLRTLPRCLCCSLRKNRHKVFEHHLLTTELTSWGYNVRVRQRSRE